MIMELKEFIDHAFEKYEESPELIDSKVALITNLQDRLNSLEATLLKRTDALHEIRTHLPDINKIAEEMRLDKKKEVFEIQYTSFRHFVTRPRPAIYPLLGVITLF